MAAKSELLHEGSVFSFGHYPQSLSGDDEPIEWLVIKRGREDIWAVTLCGLDTMSIIADDPGLSDWSESAVRKFANGPFLQYAFNIEERLCLLHTSLETEGFIYTHNPKVCHSNDYVFLLSASEAESLFPDAAASVCHPTLLALAHGAHKWDVTAPHSSWWWLRNAGMGSKSAAIVMADGTVNRFGEQYDDRRGCLRWAVRLSVERLLDYLAYAEETAV